MKKKAIDFKKYADMHENKEIVGTDGTKVIVRDHISYANKVAMAVALVEENVMIHDDSVCYESFAMPAERIKGIMKYYTDVPVDDADAQEVADFAINNGLIGQIRDYIHDDYYEFEDVFVTLIRSVMDNYEDDQSLAKAIKTSFGFLFTGEDVTETLAKAEAAKDTVFDALGALREKEAQDESKMKDGKLKVEGKLLNFAKKE